MRTFERIAFALKTTLASGAVCLGLGAEAGSGAYGEGFSALTPGAEAEIYRRAFSLGNMREICDASPVPAKFRAGPLTLNIGERLWRSANSGVVIEAYDANGKFLAHVPIIISMFDPQNVALTSPREDGDYLEADREGEAEFRVSWACGSADKPAIEIRIPIAVSAE